MNFSTIKQEIENADIISFDVFDTLITRQVLHPKDVFSLVEILANKEFDVDFDFSSIRIKAEEICQKSIPDSSYTLNDIYNNISKMVTLDSEKLLILKDIEFKAEELLTYPRNDIKDLFLKIYNSGKKIILVSDMYLSSEQISCLLKKCGYPTDIEMFVSNEYKAEKSNGSLWKKVINNFAGKSILHFGDSKAADYISVRKNGQKAVLLQSSLEKFENSKLYLSLQRHDSGTFGNSLLLGILCNKILFNNAFSDSYDMDLITGIWMGAPLACFLRWLINNKDDSLLLFVTREGYIFQPMYLSYCKTADIEPQKNCLFYTSRQAVSRAYVTGEQEFDDLLELDYKGYLDKFIETRCNFSDVSSEYKNIKIELPKQKDFVKEKTMPYLDKIFETSRLLKSVYLKYIDDCCREADTENLTIVDIGYSGTTQFLLSNMSCKKIAGKYFMTSAKMYPEKIGCSYSSLFEIEDGVHPIYENLNFLEATLQVPYGQLICLKQDEDGNYITECNNAKQTSPNISKAQKSFLDFTNEDSKWFKLLGSNFNYSVSLTEDIWVALIYYNLLPEELIDDFVLDDDFLGNNTWKYDKISHKWKSDINEIPLVFNKNIGVAERKLRFKNFVKSKTPDFMFDILKTVWVKFIK